MIERKHELETIRKLLQRHPIVGIVGALAPRGCKRDGGSPSEIGMQVQISNHLKLLWSKAMVVSVEEKAYEIRQV